MTIFKALLTLLFALTTLWGAMALFYQAPPGARVVLIVLWVLIGIAGCAALWWWSVPALGAFVLTLAGLLGWWSQIKPHAERDWAPEVARLATGHYDARFATLDQVRNFSWRTLDDYDVLWEARRYDLDALQSVDMLLSEWGAAGIAHVLVSFGFADGNFVTFSVEIRKQRGEAFSEYGGFFRQFEASIIAADERDIVQVRTNVRHEQVSLYRVNLSPDARRALFIAYVDYANALKETPQFYNTLTANCTTVVYDMLRQIVGGIPLDYRLLLSAHLPEYVHDLGALADGYSVEELRARGRINERAAAAQGAADFSTQIRRDVPGTE